MAITNIDGIQSLIERLPITHWDFEFTAGNVNLLVSLIFYAIIPDCSDLLSKDI